MKISETNVIRGPNRWSDTFTRLIVLKIDFGHGSIIDKLNADDLAKEARHQVPGLPAKHSDILPEKDVARTLLVIITQLLEQSGFTVDFSKVIPDAGEHKALLVYSYETERAAIFAAQSAASFAEAILEDRSYDLRDDIDRLKSIRRRYAMGPTTAYLLSEVKRRGIPYRQFDQGSLITVGYGSRQKKIRTAVTDATSGLGMEMASDKDETKRILEEARVPVPKGILVGSEEELIARIGEVKFPLVIKPLDGNHGRGVTTDVRSVEKAVFGYAIASRISDIVIAEEFIEGEDYRLLVINSRLIAATKRRPAYVTGDGRSTIQELIDKTNLDPQRGETTDHVLAPIKVDKVTEKILTEKKLTLSSVLPQGQVLYLKDTANISAGGTATDVTDEVHPDIVFMAERVARIFRLDICGIDLITSDISKSLRETKGAVIEVNAGPGIRMHSDPQWGKSRNVAAPIVSMLFDDAATARIPVMAIGGAKNRSITARLAYAMAMHEGLKPGCNTSQGIYLDGHCIQEGDCSGFFSAQEVLFDPVIDFAVLECDQKSMFRTGLPFDSCNVSVITGLETEDDYPELDILARSVVSSGCVILNAEDKTLCSLGEKLSCKVGLFGSETNEAIRRHIAAGGFAATLQKEMITVHRQNARIALKVPPAFLEHPGEDEGVVAAVMAGFAAGFSASSVRKALESHGIAAGTEILVSS